MGVWVDEWLDVQVGEWVVRWVDGWMGEWMDGKDGMVYKELSAKMMIMVTMMATMTTMMMMIIKCEHTHTEPSPRARQYSKPLPCPDLPNPHNNTSWQVPIKPGMPASNRPHRACAGGAFCRLWAGQGPEQVTVS